MPVCAYLLLLPIRVSAEKLTSTGTPPGATVEINGFAVGATPFAKDFPGGYCHRTHASLGSRLEHPLVARLNLAAYAANAPSTSRPELGFEEPVAPKTPERSKGKPSSPSASQATPCSSVSGKESSAPPENFRPLVPATAAARSSTSTVKSPES